MNYNLVKTEEEKATVQSTGESDGRKNTSPSSAFPTLNNEEGPEQKKESTKAKEQKLLDVEATGNRETTLATGTTDVPSDTNTNQQKDQLELLNPSAPRNQDDLTDEIAKCDDGIEAILLRKIDPVSNDRHDEWTEEKTDFDSAIPVSTKTHENHEKFEPKNAFETNSDKKCNREDFASEIGTVSELTQVRRIRLIARFDGDNVSRTGSIRRELLAQEEKDLTEDSKNLTDRLHNDIDPPEMAIQSKLFDDSKDSSASGDEPAETNHGSAVATQSLALESQHEEESTEPLESMKGEISPTLDSVIAENSSTEQEHQGDIDVSATVDETGRKPLGEAYGEGNSTEEESFPFRHSENIAVAARRRTKDVEAYINEDETGPCTTPNVGDDDEEMTSRASVCVQMNHDEAVGCPETNSTKGSPPQSRSISDEGTIVTASMATTAEASQEYDSMAPKADQPNTPLQQTSMLVAEHETIGHTRPSATPKKTVEGGSKTTSFSGLGNPSIVRAIREKFERSGENFSVDGLSVDMEQFYMDQRVQSMIYQQKKKEALGLCRGAEDLEGNVSCDMEQSVSVSVASIRETFVEVLRGGRALVFAVHEQNGLLLRKAVSKDCSTHTYDVPGSLVNEADCAAAERDCDNASDRQLAAVRIGAARELKKTGIDLKGRLNRLIPAKLPNNEKSNEKGEKKKAYFFLLLNDRDLSHGLGPNTPNCIFEKDAATAAALLSGHDSDMIDACVLAIEASHTLEDGDSSKLREMKSTAITPQNPDMTPHGFKSDCGESDEVLVSKEDSVSKEAKTDVFDDIDYRVEEKGSLRSRGDASRVAAGKCTFPDAAALLTYIGSDFERLEDIPTLLSFLSTRDVPLYTGDKVIQVKKDLKFVQEQRRCGRELQSSTVVCNGDDPLQQLFNMKAVLRENGNLFDTMQRLHHILHTKEQTGDDDLVIEEVISGLDDVLTDLESRITFLTEKKEFLAAESGQGNCNVDDHVGVELVAQSVSNDKYHIVATSADDSLEDRRAILGGDIYPFASWELLQGSRCRLRNKIVLADHEEVEVVAVILKINDDQHPSIFDSGLCVLNNEKPSAMKQKRQIERKMRVKFLLKADSSVGTSTDSKDAITTGAICCWLC